MGVFDLFGGGDSGGYDMFGGTDWLGLGSGGSGGGTDWGSFFDSDLWNSNGGGGDSSSGFGSIVNGVLGAFGGGGSSGSGGGNQSLWASLLGGLGGAAQGYLSGKDLAEQAKLQGLEVRKTAGYTSDLKDFYDQKNKARKRASLDTYGQFSRLPAGFTPAPAIDQPNKPSVDYKG